MKMILKYLEELKKECVLAPLFKMLEALFELFVPLVVASIIDRGIGQQDTAYIVKMCLMLLGLAIIGLVCSITAQYFSAKAAVGCATGIRHALFKHIQSLSFTEMDDIGTSTLMTRMTSDINQVQNGINLVLRLFLRSPFIVVGAVIMSFTIDWKIGLIFFFSWFLQKNQEKINRPSVLVTAAVLAALPKGCLIVDLASKPGGTDFAAARRLGHTALHALSLPTVWAPETAGEALARTVQAILQEREGRV